MKPLSSETVDAITDTLFPDVKVRFEKSTDRWQRVTVVDYIMDKYTLLDPEVKDFWEFGGYRVDNNGDAEFPDLYLIDKDGDKATKLTDGEFETLTQPVVLKILENCKEYFDPETIAILKLKHHAFRAFWESLVKR